MCSDKTKLRNGSPRHVQVSNWLRDQIERGIYAAEDRLPSESQMIDQFSVSRITVRRALQTLESDGLIYRHQGLGSFVSDNPPGRGDVRLTDIARDMETAGLSVRSEVLHFKPEVAPARIASLLSLDDSTSVMRLDRLRYGNGEPIVFDVCWLPVFYAQLLDGKDLERHSIVEIMDRDFNISVCRSRFRFESVNASNEIARQLLIPWGRALLLIERLSYTDSDRPLYVQQRYHRCDRVGYEMELEGRRGMPLREFIPVFKT
jgi:GntR family transcriptional regulator